MVAPKVVGKCEIVSGVPPDVATVVVVSPGAKPPPAVADAETNPPGGGTFEPPAAAAVVEGPGRAPLALSRSWSLSFFPEKKSTSRFMFVFSYRS